MTDWIHPNPHIRKLVGMGVVTVLISLWGWWMFAWLTPPQHNPFTPLDLTIKPGLVTGYKLDQLGHNPAQCFGLLDQAGVGYTRVSKTSTNPECGISDGLTLDKSITPYSQTLSMSCRLAATLYVWERHVVIPAAEEMLGQKVKEIETMGSYSCRRVNGAETGKWSEHARGDAIDVSGFVLEDGTRVMVEDVFGADTKEGRFLKAVRDKACGLFSVVLSPDYNKLHHNHLHLDMGFYAMCS